MRLRHPDGSLLHLAYCSNVHPADDLDGVAAQLERYAARVRARLDVPVLGVGPVGRRAGARHRCRRASARATRPPGSRSRHAERLSVPARSTLRWSSATCTGRIGRRTSGVQYTFGLAELLAVLLPAGIEEGSISTLPLGWREGLGRRRAGSRADCSRRPRLASSRRSTRARASASGSLWSRSPGARSRRSRRRATRWRGWRRSGSVSASMPAISRCSSRPRPMRSRGFATRACRSSRRRSRARFGFPTRRLRRGASCWHGSTSRGSCIRSASA